MTDTELHHCSATVCKYYDMGDCAFKRIEIDETGRWITIDPKLKAWYEEDILFIDSLLSHLKPGTERYNRLVMERKRRVEPLRNS